MARFAPIEIVRQTSEFIEVLVRDRLPRTSLLATAPVRLHFQELPKDQ
jgi:hypothetical protein